MSARKETRKKKDASGEGGERNILKKVAQFSPRKKVGGLGISRASKVGPGERRGGKKQSTSVRKGNCTEGQGSGRQTLK